MAQTWWHKRYILIYNDLSYYKEVHNFTQLFNVWMCHKKHVKRLLVLVDTLTERWTNRQVEK